MVMVKNIISSIINSDYSSPVVKLIPGGSRSYMSAKRIYCLEHIETYYQDTKKYTAKTQP